MDHARLPSVDGLARLLGADPTLAALPRPLIVEVARDAIAEARKAPEGADPETLAHERLVRIVAQRPQRVINATGVLLHTNLGRAPLHPAAADAAAEVARGYGNVEFDVATGRRGTRHGYIDHLLTSLTGAEAGLAVNNNAGALLLSLAALASPGSTLVSRGELIEIGGSFRLPELMAASGTTLIEVGTTNRTRAADYAAEAAKATLVLKVHPSNYRVEGFSESAGYGELAEVAHEAGIPLVADVGSGLLDVRATWLDGPPAAWLAEEPGVRQTLDAGADVVLFSGDKLLGGPQSGIAVGRRNLIARMARHPMMRALRLDGPALAALGTTLELYGSGRGDEIPFWHMATMPVAALTSRLEQLRQSAPPGAAIIDDVSLPGAGSVPGETIRTPVLAVSDAADAQWRRLLEATPPIVARRSEGRLLIDLRTVAPLDDPHVAAALT